MWAVSGLSATLWARTSDSQRVLTNVVRPVPEAPERAVRKRAVEVGDDGRTDDHEGELDTLLDLVSSASASERHFSDEEASREETCPTRF